MGKIQKKALEIKNLSKSYGKLQALKDVEFHIPEGKVAGLVGPNGAGKTTIIKSILGFLKYKGNISYKNGESNKLPFGYLAEDEGYYTWMTGREYLKYFSMMFDVENSSKEIEEKIKLVGLENRWNDKISTYSNGMRRRLGIARTLLSDPDLIILDEPLAGLDPFVKNNIMSIIEDIAEENKSFLISSHQLKDIERICDWLVLIKEGKIIKFGDPAEMTDRLKSGKEMILDIDPDHIKKATEIKDIDVVEEIKRKGNTLMIYGKRGNNTDKKILMWMIENDIDFSLKHGSLDSIYKGVFDE